MNCNECRQLFKEKNINREMTIVAGVGSGITALAAKKGGADFLSIYNTAVYRMMGLPTALAFLPYDDCNALTIDATREIIKVVGDTPVIMGLGAHDPRRSISELVQQAVDFGVDGISNEPFIGMYGEGIRSQLDKMGFGFSREVEMIAVANARNLITFGWAFSAEEAAQMANAGATMIGAMIAGVTSKSKSEGEHKEVVTDAVNTIKSIMSGVKGTNIPVIIHGGPLHDVKTVSHIINLTNADGYATGSTGERIPVENAVKNAIADFKSIRRP